MTLSSETVIFLLSIAAVAAAAVASLYQTELAIAIVVYRFVVVSF